MWKCTDCGETHEDQFDACWKCGMGRDGADDPEFECKASTLMAGDEPAGAAPPARRGGQVRFKVFRSSFSSWDTLFESAVSFANEIGPDRLLSISHSVDGVQGMVVVWYRDGE